MRHEASVSPSIPVEVRLSISSAPALGHDAELTCSVSSVYRVANASLVVKLPEGFVVEGGGLSWRGGISEKGRTEINATIRAIKTGNWTIEATGGYDLPRGAYFDTDRIYISVAKEHAQASKRPPPPSERALATQIDPSKLPRLPTMPPQGITPEPRFPSTPSSP